MTISNPISIVSFPVLSDFNQVNFESISNLGLTNRVETKFVFPSDKTDQVLKTLTGNYKVVQRNNQLSFKYVTVYLDTDEFRFFNQHLRGELSRNKVRYRNYEFTGDSFLEVKMKTNKGRTLKWRIPGSFSNSPFSEDAEDFLKEYLPVESYLLKPVLISRFSRTTFVNFDMTERLTIDYNLSFESVKSGKIIDLPYLSIAEVKKEIVSYSSPFSATLRRMNIYPLGFSKYCMGSALLNDSLKLNLLKPKLIILNKIRNGFN
ncbi:MAG: polyphosphate polymerase domain-containing protein [Bacteroidetes bacterium]|nr:polyphosphate polymerase domain-containing protein [Bacteroidota bacterium]